MKRLMATVLLFATGCATMHRGPMQRVRIESDPPGAEVELIGCGVSAEERKTPVTVLVPRRVKRCSVVVLHEGYEPARIFLQRRHLPAPVDDTAVFEFLCGDCNSLSDLFIAATLGGVIYATSKGVDAVAGSKYELEPRHVQVALRHSERSEESGREGAHSANPATQIPR